MTLLYKIATSVMTDIGEDKPSPGKDYSVPYSEPVEEKPIPAPGIPGADATTLMPLASEE
jgi:hypothetical protein